MRGRTYRYLTEEPLFPFGYGLSYTQYKLEDIRYDDGKINGTVSVTKPSRIMPKGRSAVVQVYIKGVDIQEPFKQLIGFQRVAVDHSGKQTFSINIDPYWLRQFDEATQEVVPIPDGKEITLLVGFSSADHDLIELTTKK